jgi:homoserine dehydrogenase
MTTRKNLNIGLFGFGCVGQGLYNVLKNSTGIKAEISRICVKDQHKQRPLDKHLFTYDKNEILNDPEINLVVELINHAGEAFEIVKQALLNGKDVVTANKKMIAENFHELIRLQEETGGAVLYEASACGSIPIIRTLEEYYDNETLNGVSGIFNGTTNFILTKIFNEGLDYDTALTRAKRLGFAEIDPTLDVDGYDAKYKLQILAGHSYGVFTRPDEVLNFGIRHIKTTDFELAKSLKAKIKLIAHVGKINEEEITMYVAPQLISETHLLFNVENEYNGVIVEASFSDKQLFIGKGAGGNPTGSAVLSDISAGSYKYKYEYKKNTQRKYAFTNNVNVHIILSGEKAKSLELKTQWKQDIGENTFIVKTTIADLIVAKDKIELAGIFVSIVTDEVLLENVKKQAKEKVESV